MTQLMVGVVGVGKMGRRFATHLTEAGRVVVRDTDAQRAREVADATGARVAASARELAGEVDVVVCSLPNDAAAHAAYIHPDGILAGLRPEHGTIVVETSTLSPRLVGELDRRVADAGGTLVAATVSGSPQAAEARRLLVMAAGQPLAVQRAWPLLEAIGAHVRNLGADPRAAAVMKLAINQVVYQLYAAALEALRLATAAGIPREVAVELLAEHSAVTSPALRDRWEGLTNPRRAPLHYPLTGVEKDLTLAEEFAADHGVPVGLAASVRAWVQAGVAAGLGDLDVAALDLAPQPRLPTVPTPEADPAA